MIFRPLIAVVICFISMAGIAQNPRKVCEVYETEAFGLSTNGADGEFLVPARLVVRPAELNGGVTSITLELVSPTTASLIRLTKYSLPPAYESLLAEQDELLLETGVTGYSGSSTHFDITAMASRKGSSAPAYVVTVLNALGEPAAGVRLEIKAGMFDKSVSLGMQSVPADGRVRLKIPQPPDSNGRVPPNSLFYRPFSTLSILATDQSGQRQQLQFPSVVEPGEAANFETLELAFLPRETTAPAYRGKVLGPDGQPSPGTRMVSYWLQTPGMGGSQMYGNASTIYPAPDGTFCFGVPQNLLQFKLGVRDLPASSTLRVKIAGLPGVDLRTDRENVIQLPQMETIRVQLMGSDGAPLSGLKAGYSINVTAESKGQPDAKARTSITPTARLTDAANAVVSLDSIAVPHQYTFTINDVSYEPVFLDKGAGSQLVQLHPNMSRAEVTGTVLAAEDGQPVAGAYVLSAWDQDAPHVLSKLSPDLLESTWAEWDPGALTADSPDKTFTFKEGTLFSVYAMGKTDEEGKFRLPFENGRVPKTVHVHIPGRMTATARVIDMQRPEGNLATYDLPAVALPLAASVTVPIIPPDRVPDKFLNGEGVEGNTLRGLLGVHVGFERKGPWTTQVPAENGTKSNPWTLVTSSGWVSPGNQPVLEVPANAKFDVTVYASHSQPTVGTAAWHDLGPLSPGENMILPDKKVSVKIPFLVTVKKKDGSPAVGVSVRIDGHMPLTADNDGSVIGWTSGHVERVDVMTDSTTWQPAAQKQDITVNPGEDITRIDMVIP